MNSKLFRRHLCFLVFISGSLIVFRTPLKQLISFSLSHDYGSHIILVAPVSAYLIHLKRQAVFSKSRVDFFPGLSLFLGGSILACASHVYSPARREYLSVEILALVLLWMSGFILCYGKHSFRTARFALWFLLLLVPIPNFLIEKLIFSLQAGSATASYWLFELFDVSVFKEGNMLRFPTLDVKITEECSGIRSSLALLITILLVSEFALYSLWRKSLLALSVIPVVILKNAVRIVTVTLLTIYVNRAFMYGRIHTSGGILFYVLGLLMLVPILSLLRRSEALRD